MTQTASEICEKDIQAILAKGEALIGWIAMKAENGNKSH